MAPSRRSQAAGHVALCAALAGWAYAAKCFVSPSARATASPQSLRGGAELRRFPAAPEEAAQEASHPLVGLAVCAATLGLAVTMVASPVRADDEGGADSQSTIAGKISRKKKKREAQVEEAKKVEKVAAPAAAPAAAQESGGGFSLPTISFSIPNNFEAPKAPAAVQTSAEAAPVKPFKVRGDKVYINPSDELDLDEVPLGAPNPPLLAAFLFGPSFVYLAFWVLGSLEII